ncbi:MAG: chondroitinase-B domain-containing protein [Nonlabens sp.]|uniref:chondroitinase-B domain-containing protein n=1 Tax=Nonlabens sp. TaxID=1888209 RepID=UPI003EF67F87
MKHIISRNLLLSLLFFAVLSSLESAATDYTVSSASQFNALALQPCDVVTWTDGTYSNQDVVFNATGTQGNPIVLKAQTPGGVIFTGSSEMNVYGDYLIIDGFYWNGGTGTNNHVEFRRSGSNTDFANNTIIRNCAFNDLVTAGDSKSRWIVLYGVNNTVENCSFLNKNSTGVCILVELAFQTAGVAGHILRDNYFFNVTNKDGRTNSGDSEGIRIGESAFQSVNAGVLVERNYFHDVDGEAEIISNKSRGNMYRNNTFRSCRGSLVMRHGSGALIEGNYFIGEGKASSGGIRISDKDHVIINNYIQGVDNSSSPFNNGITIMAGDAASGGTSNGYQNVSNVLIAFNTIYNSDDPIYFNDLRASNVPQGTIANNLIYSTNGTIVSGSVAAIGGQMTYIGNVFGGSPIGITNAGITNANGNFSQSGEIFKPSTTGPAADAATGNYPQVFIDIEGLTRPSTSKDVGAHEIVGATGTITNAAPIVDAAVGNGTGACYLDAAGMSSSSACVPFDYSTVCAPVAVTGVMVSPPMSILALAGTQQLTATVQPNNASNNQVTWTTSDTTIATVDVNGLVTATGGGIATITATTVDGSFTDTASIEVLTAPDCVQGTNLALSGTVASFTDEQAGNPASNVIDGDASNRWSAMNFPQSMVIDLGAGLNINAVNLFPYQNRDYQYLIEGSATSATSGFTTLVDRQSNTTQATSINDTFNDTVIRYVRFTVTGAATYTGPWVSIADLQVICAGAVLSADSNLLSTQIKMYPSPFKEQLTIDISDSLISEITTLRIVDVMGKVVYKTENVASKNQITLSSTISPGMYFVQFIGNNREVISTEKLIKE